MRLMVAVSVLQTAGPSQAVRSLGGVSYKPRQPLRKGWKLAVLLGAAAVPRFFLALRFVVRIIFLYGLPDFCLLLGAFILLP
jgi:hypothetical protein